MNIFDHATDASNFLKAISHPQRLVILCLLLDGEKTVGELEIAMAMRQPAISQQLARLREDNLVETRREGKNIYYTIAKDEVRIVIAALNEAFCKQ